MLTWGGGRFPALPTRAGTLRRLLTGTLLALLVAAAPPAAHAGPAGGECPPGQTDCSVWDDDPSVPGDPGGGGDTGGSTGGGGATPKCQWNGKPLPCYNDYLGWFNNGDGCYYKLAEPQPTAPEGQQWYVITCNGGDLSDQRVALRDSPPPGYGTPPDPEELARRALARIRMLPPRIAVAPHRTTGSGLVGLPVWMWAQKGLSFFGPNITETERDRGLEVTVTAHFDKVVWNMGNGDKVPCTGPGTEYSTTGRYAGKPSPTCGYDSGYDRAGTYRVSATTYWTVRWTSSSGERGQIPQTRTSGPTEITIDELQVVAR